MRCHAKNHFATVCQKRSVRFCTELTSNCDERQEVAVVTTIDSEHLSVRKSVSSVSTTFASKIFAMLEIASKPISFQIDSGASCNVVRSQDLANTNASITATTQRLCLYDNSVLEPVGKTEVQVYNPKTRKRYLAEFVVVHKAATSILGAATSQELGLIKVCSENILNTVHAANSVSLLTKEEIIAAYPCVFCDELGTFPGKAHLEIDDSVTPVKMPLRRTPIAIKEKLMEEIRRLENLGVIVQMEEPSDWISGMVATEKKSSGALRICIDPRPLNKALRRSHYPLPTIEDVLPQLHNAKVSQSVISEMAIGTRSRVK